MADPAEKLEEGVVRKERGGEEEERCGVVL